MCVATRPAIIPQAYCRGSQDRDTDAAMYRTDVAHMESQVRLLRLNKDAQGEALMRTIDGRSTLYICTSRNIFADTVLLRVCGAVLLRENTRLRLIIGTMSSLLGNGSAGALADMGVSRQELHEAVTVGDKARLSLVAKDISDAATQVHRARRDKPDPPVASYMETEKHHQSFWDALHETFATLKKPQPQKQEQEQEKPRTASGSGPPTTNGPVGMSSASAPSMHDPVLESVSTAGPPPQHGAPFQFPAFAPMAGPSTYPPQMATAMPGAPYTLDTHIPASSGTAFLGLDTDSLNTTPSSTDLNNAFTPSDLFAGLCMPDVFPAPAHSQAGQLEAQAFELVKAHVSQRMLDPAYSMPAALQPTTMQSSLPHDPAIDSVLWPSMRDKLIASDVQARLAQGIGQVLNAKTVLQDLQSMTTIHPTWVSRGLRLRRLSKRTEPSIPPTGPSRSASLGSARGVRSQVSLSGRRSHSADEQSMASDARRPAASRIAHFRTQPDRQSPYHVHRPQEGLFHLRQATLSMSAASPARAGYSRILQLLHHFAHAPSELFSNIRLFLRWQPRVRLAQVAIDGCLLRNVVPAVCQVVSTDERWRLASHVHLERLEEVDVLS